MALKHPSFSCQSCPCFLPTPLTTDEGTCRSGPPTAFLVPERGGDLKLLSAWPTVKRGQWCFIHPEAQIAMQQAVVRTVQERKQPEAPPKGMPFLGKAVETPFPFQQDGPVEAVRQPAAAGAVSGQDTGEDPRMRLGMKDMALSNGKATDVEVETVEQPVTVPKGET